MCIRYAFQRYDIALRELNNRADWTGTAIFSESLIFRKRENAHYVILSAVTYRDCYFTNGRKFAGRYIYERDKLSSLDKSMIMYAFLVNGGGWGGTRVAIHLQFLFCHGDRGMLNSWLINADPTWTRDIVSECTVSLALISLFVDARQLLPELYPSSPSFVAKPRAFWWIMQIFGATVIRPRESSIPGYESRERKIS